VNYHNAIEIRGLEKSFRQFKLGPMDLTVPKGAIYGLIGPNGAGKTTTIDLVMGMGREDRGEIRVFGLESPQHEAAIKRRIGYVSPDLSYNAWWRVNRLIHFIRKFYADWDDAYCVQLLSKLGIGWSDNIKTMSFGTRVKLALVIALSHRPDLLLLDEPTIGVDAVSKNEIYGELLAAVQDAERTILISSHGLSEIERFTDHLGMIKNGQMLLEGSTADIVDRFRMVDCLCENGAVFGSDGVYPQDRQNGRHRVLVDKTRFTRAKLESMGAREISESPVTLEELFVAVMQTKGDMEWNDVSSSISSPAGIRASV